jgi:hypothetical protein
VGGFDETALDSESSPNGGVLRHELYTSCLMVINFLLIPYRLLVARARTLVGAVIYEPPHRRSIRCTVAILLLWLMAPSAVRADGGGESVGLNMHKSVFVQDRVDRINTAYRISAMTNDDFFAFQSACESTVGRHAVYRVFGAFPNHYCAPHLTPEVPLTREVLGAVERTWKVAYEFLDELLSNVSECVFVSAKGFSTIVQTYASNLVMYVRNVWEVLVRICWMCTISNVMISTILISSLVFGLWIIWKCFVLIYVVGKYNCGVFVKETRRHLKYNPLNVVEKYFGNWQSSATDSVKEVNTEKATTLVDLVYVNTVSGKNVYKTKDHGSLRFVLPCVDNERMIDSSKLLIASKQHAHCCAIVTAHDEFIENASIVSCKNQYYLVTAHHGIVDDDVYVCGVGATKKYKLFINGQPNPTLFQSRHSHTQGDVDVFKISSSFSSLVGVKTHGCPDVKASGGAYTNQGLIMKFVLATENGYQSHTSSGNIGMIATPDTSNMFSVQHTCSTQHGACGAVAVEDGTNVAVLLHTSGYKQQPRNAGADLTCIFVDLDLLERVSAPAEVYKGDDGKIDNEDSGRIRGRRLHEDFLDSGRHYRGEVRNASHFADMEKAVSTGDYKALVDAINILNKKLEAGTVARDTGVASKEALTGSGNVPELIATATPDSESLGLNASIQPCLTGGAISGQSSATPHEADGGSKKKRGKRAKGSVTFEASNTSAPLDGIQE